MSDSRGVPEATRRAAANRSNPPPPNSDSDRIWDLLVLIGASFFAPLIVWANSSERADFPGFGMLGLGVFTVALALRWTMVRLGLDLRGSTFSVAALVFAFTNAGLLLDRGVSRLVLLAGSIAVSALLYALKDSRILGMAILWAGLFVFAYPWLVWATAGTSVEERTTGDPEPLSAMMTGKPRDMVVIVLDGYANSVVLSDLYGLDTSEFDSQLALHGFEVNSTANANYGRTRLSVASVVQLGHPLEPGTFNAADFDHLLSVIGGDNVLSRWLQRNDYTFTYVESGWFGTRCATSVDICIEGPWPDESFYDVSNRSLLKDLPG
ncbi:MAG: hypothetical protein R3282_03265, partial [Rhodothermales bacterium]|nr:hypothetical protein [Rhodothermales bacterium]